MSPTAAVREFGENVKVEFAPTAMMWVVAAVVDEASTRSARKRDWCILLLVLCFFVDELSRCVKFRRGEALQQRGAEVYGRAIGTGTKAVAKNNPPPHLLIVVAA